MKFSAEFLEMPIYKAGKPIAETQREFGLTQVVKLASNENPLGVSPFAKKAIIHHLDEQFLYPDPTSFDLLNTLSKKWKIPPTNLAFGNGSDELIDILTRIFCAPGEGVLTSECCFQAYPLSAAGNRAKLYQIPLTKDWKFDLAGMADFYLNNPSKNIRIIFIANPNNPTGTYNTKTELDEFFQRVGNREDLLIVFDEAYTEFAQAKDYVSSQDYVGKISNLVTLRTFSKAYGLAGLRVGAMVGPEDVVGIYNRVRKPFNLNGLAQVATQAALEDEVFIQQTRELTWLVLKKMEIWLNQNKLPFLPSQGNFIMFDTQRDAMTVYQKCLENGLILRPLLNYGLKKHLRWSVGTVEQFEFATRVLEKVLPQISNGAK